MSTDPPPLNQLALIPLPAIVKDPSRVKGYARDLDQTERVRNKSSHGVFLNVFVYYDKETNLL